MLECRLYYEGSEMLVLGMNCLLIVSSLIDKSCCLTVRGGFQSNEFLPQLPYFIVQLTLLIELYQGFAFFPCFTGNGIDIGQMVAD